jgi:hypothetical protein
LLTGFNPSIHRNERASRLPDTASVHWTTAVWAYARALSTVAINANTTTPDTRRTNPWCNANPGRASSYAWCNAHSWCTYTSAWQHAYAWRAHINGTRHAPNRYPGAGAVHDLGAYRLHV